MRAIWKGHISFALVTIPISLVSATRGNELSLHFLHKGDLSTVSYKRFCDAEGKEVEWADLTRGYEYEKGQYIEVTDEDIDRAEQELTKTIQIMEFVKESEIDPVYFDKPYYLEPQKGGERAYALMREALAQSKRVGIAKVVLKSKEHLSAVKAVGNLLTLQTMRFAHEIVDPGELNLPKAEISTKEMDLANTLINSMSDSFDPLKYKDDHYEKVMQVIQMKIEGISPKASAAVHAKAPGKVVDLMEVLKQSLVETQKKDDTHTKSAPEPAHEETVTAGPSRTKTRKAR